MLTQSAIRFIIMFAHSDLDEDVLSSVNGDCASDSIQRCSRPSSSLRDGGAKEGIL